MMKNKTQKNRGSTMVEVLVAFLLVSIILGALYQVVKFSSNMYLKAVDMTRQVEAFEEKMYKKNLNPQEIIKTDTVMDSMTLVVDTTRGAGKNGSGNILTAGAMNLGTIKKIQYEQVKEGNTGYKLRLFRYE